MSKALSVVALLLAVAALAINFVIPGPAGPAGAMGAQGPRGTDGTNGANGANGAQGPPGAGTLMNSTSYQAATTMAGCVNFLTVALTVPSRGRIAVSAYAHYWIEHTAGTTDLWASMIRTSPTDCSLSFGLESTWAIDEISGAWPTDTIINQALSVQAVFPISGAGTYTYHLNTEMAVGQSASDQIVNGVMVLVFYPS